MMNREQREALLRETQFELAAAQRQVVHLQQVVDGLSGLLNPRDPNGEFERGFASSSRPATPLAERTIRRPPSITEAERNARNRSEAVRTAEREVRRKSGLVAEAAGVELTAEPLKPRDAILYVMSRSPGIPVSPRQVYRDLESRHMVNADYRSGQAAYDAALRRLAEEPGSGVDQDSSGSYIYRGPRMVLTRTVSGDGQMDYKVQPEGASP